MLQHLPQSDVSSMYDSVGHGHTPRTQDIQASRQSIRVKVDNLCGHSGQQLVNSDGQLRETLIPAEYTNTLFGHGSSRRSVSSGRIGALMLWETTEKMFSDALQRANTDELKDTHSAEMWDMVLSEVARQVYTHCAERGLLVEHARVSMQQLFAKLAEELLAEQCKVAMLEAELRSTESSLSDALARKGAKRTWNPAGVLGMMKYKGEVSENHEEDKDREIEMLKMKLQASETQNKELGQKTSTLEAQIRTLRDELTLAEEERDAILEQSLLTKRPQSERPRSATLGTKQGNGHAEEVAPVAKESSEKEAESIQWLEHEVNQFYSDKILADQVRHKTRRPLQTMLEFLRDWSTTRFARSENTVNVFLRTLHKFGRHHADIQSLVNFLHEQEYGYLEIQCMYLRIMVLQCDNKKEGTSKAGVLDRVTLESGWAVILETVFGNLPPLLWDRVSSRLNTAWEQTGQQRSDQGERQIPSAAFRKVCLEFKLELQEDFRSVYEMSFRRIPHKQKDCLDKNQFQEFLKVFADNLNVDVLWNLALKHSSGYDQQSDQTVNYMGLVAMAEGRPFELKKAFRRGYTKIMERCGEIDQGMIDTSAERYFECVGQCHRKSYVLTPTEEAMWQEFHQNVIKISQKYKATAAYERNQ